MNVPSSQCLERFKKQDVEDLVTFIKNSLKTALRRYTGRWTDDQIDELTNDFFASLMEKLCQKVLQNNILDPDAYLYVSIENFLFAKLRSLNAPANKPLSLNSSIFNVSETNENDDTEFTEVVCATDDFVTSVRIDVLAEELLTELLAECERRRGNFLRYLCFLISSRYYGTEEFRDSSWSKANEYKIVERTRAFLKEFQERFSIEDRVLGKILILFYELACHTNIG